MIDFADLDDALDGATTPAPAYDIRANAHIVNGGDAEFTCPACKGSGVFRSYTGRVVGNCFKCKGKKTVGKAVAAAAKGKATKAANEAAWRNEHRDLIAALSAIREWNGVAQRYLADIETYGSLRDDKIEKANAMLAKLAATREAKREARVAAAPAVDVSAIQKLFDTAVENDVKRPIFRTVDIIISKAPMTGRNPGALYIKTTEGGEYVGKIVDGKFHGQPAALEQLRAVAVDPAAEAIRYAQKFSACGICGRSTIDPVSVRSAVGPICASKWGLEHAREAARESLAEDARREAEAKAA
jgi:predicted RNA-binding Zn-ribbon protein involved in translation (DUF1610 family)